MPRGALPFEPEVRNCLATTSPEDRVERIVKSVRFSALKIIFPVDHRDDLRNIEDLFWTAGEMNRFRLEAIKEIQDTAASLKVSIDEAQFILQQPDSKQMACIVRPVWPPLDRTNASRFPKKEMSLLEYYCLKDCLSCERDCFLGIPTNW